MNNETTLICTAVYAEAAPLIRRLQLRLESATGTYRNNDVAMIISGMGAERAREAIKGTLDREAPARVIVAGVSGGLDPRLEIGDVRSPESVIDAQTGEVFNPTDDAHGGDRQGALVTVARIAGTAADKATLRDTFNADLVDMETSAIAQVCDTQGVPWSCVRAVSDAADDTIPAGIEALVKPDGRPATLPAVAFALTRPHRIPALIRLGRNTKIAAQRLAEQVAKSITTVTPT